MAIEPTVPTEGWHGLDTVPRDGTIFGVCYHEWNVATNPLRVQLAQWLPFQRAMHAPWAPDNQVYAEGWMSLEELAAIAIAEKVAR